MPTSWCQPEQCRPQWCRPHGADLSGTNLSDADLSDANLSDADLYKANLSDADLYKANLSGADLSWASITTKQLEKARNITPEQLAQIEPSKPAATQEAKAAQISTTSVQPEIKPAQTSQEEAKQQEHKQPKQGTDATH